MEDEVNFNDLTEHEVSLKAVAIIFAISTLSQSIIEAFQEQIEEFKDFKQDELNKVSFIISYVLLFNIQRNIWEANFFIDEQKASDFEKKLFKIFEKSYGVDPISFIKDIVEYIKGGDRTREVQYVGSKICREFNKEDAFLMIKINGIFNTYLLGFFDMVKTSLKISNDSLERALKAIEEESGNHI